MSRYKVWDKQGDLFTPVGTKKTAEQLKTEKPATAVFDYVIGEIIINGESINYLSVLMQYEEMKRIYKERMASDTKTEKKITDDMTQREILDLIEAYEDEVNNREPEVTAEERIASSLEYQNMMSLPDETAE